MRALPTCPPLSLLHHRPKSVLARAAIALTASVSAVAWPCHSSAQDLQTLYEAARSYDAIYRAALAQAESEQFRAAQAAALLRPSVGVTASGVVERTDQPGRSATETNSLGASLSGRMPLFNRANGVSVQQARRSLVGAQVELEAAEQDLIVRVAQAYFDVLAAQDGLNTVRSSKRFIDEQLASARRGFEVGTATITDTREAQARFDLAAAQEIAAENDLLAKRIALNQLVGRSDVQPNPLKMLVVMPTVVPANPEEWVTLADRDHPSIRRARVGLEVAELEVDRARAAKLPTVDATASLGPAYARGSGVPRTGTTTIANLGVHLNWPLYSGGATQNRIKEALALTERSRNDVEAARRGVAQATRVAYFGVQSGAAQVRALEVAESSTQLALAATQLGYSVGVRVNLDVLNAQTQLVQTKRDLARARYDFIVGGLRLRQASGQLTPADLSVVNALLEP
ncbi:MAG: TolC family outer membrane protein [Rubrivivax sp.]|jgi:outer membrane protein|nr:TolC family outer membrane protein [Rubrivivax sp.]